MLTFFVSFFFFCFEVGGKVDASRFLEFSSKDARDAVLDLRDDAILVVSIIRPNLDSTTIVVYRSEENRFRV